MLRLRILLLLLVLLHALELLEAKRRMSGDSSYLNFTSPSCATRTAVPLGDIGLAFVLWPAPALERGPALVDSPCAYPEGPTGTAYDLAHSRSVPVGN